jgi:hypothetical protein
VAARSDLFSAVPSEERSKISQGSVAKFGMSRALTGCSRTPPVKTRRRWQSSTYLEGVEHE